MATKAARGVTSRKLAVEILAKVEAEKAFANIALANTFKNNSISERDRAFITALVQGVLRHRDELDESIASLSSQPLDKMPTPLKNNLRVAIFQLRYMDDIPASAVLNTATEIGKTTGHAGIGKFVNGLLRAYVRKSSEADQSSDQPKSLSAKYSLPQWLVDRWLKNFGEDEAQKLLEFSQSVPPLTVRTCESGITPEALLSVFTSAGMKAHFGALVPSCITIDDRGPKKGPIDKIPGYTDGLFIVQDEAAAFVSQVVDAKPGNFVIDLCAAPGGKTINIAEMMENKGKVLAVDIQEKRLEMLKKTRQRVGLTNIEIAVQDGTTFTPPALADRVLLDAPCTGTGVINRRADLRYQREEPDVATLVQLQRNLLDNAARMLKPGGILVYSTCSLEPEENEKNLQWFLETHKDFITESLAPYVPPTFNGVPETLERGWWQLMPSRNELSGFFVARLKKEDV